MNIRGGTFNGTIGLGGNVKAVVSVDIYHYHEDGSEVFFCPALRQFGYGKTEKEAGDCLSAAIKSFTTYTLKKGTTFVVLEKLGWAPKRKRAKNPNYIAPALERLLVDNEDFKDIFDTKSPKKIESRQVELCPA